MRCKQCNNEMNKTGELLERHARQTWYQCPLCNSQHTSSEHTGESSDIRVGNAMRFSATQGGYLDA